jgi:hypothetical protein
MSWMLLVSKESSVDPSSTPGFSSGFVYHREPGCYVCRGSPVLYARNGQIRDVSLKIRGCSITQNIFFEMPV